MSDSTPDPDPEKNESDKTRYERMKEAARERNRNLATAGRDIGGLPEVIDAERKELCRLNFRLFCELYFPELYAIAWSQDHLRVIAKIEGAVLRGGLFALAMPRGTGKSTLCETACLWAMLYGHQTFVALIGPTEKHAEEMLESLKTELECNELLLEDFPEVCYPIICLEGIANRCKGQLYEGERTRITWTNKMIVLPTIANAAGSGAIVKVAGLTGSIRGMKFKRADGATVRPTLAVLDDPQTDESARSPAQCAKRERILNGAVLGLAGPRKKIAGVMPCTVIAPGDMADSILDKTKHPAWGGERTAMVYRWPDRTDLWEKYREIRDEGLQNGDEGAAGTEFYRQHQEAMDAGGQVAWPERFNGDELSAIQHAWNIRFDRGDAAFFAEYQNDPLPAQEEAETSFTAEEVVERLNRHRRGLVPMTVSKVTAFIDVQKSSLWWLVVGWAEGFSGAVLDYGCWPKQAEAMYTLRDLKRTLAMEYPSAGLEGAIFSGLSALTDLLLGREWERDGGGVARIDRCVIDANWGESTDIIYEFCRQSPHAAVLIPSHGIGVPAKSKPFNEGRKKKAGETIGLNWRMVRSANRQVRHLAYDTNYWKTFTGQRLQVPLGDHGSLVLFGEKPHTHRLLADQLTAEYFVAVTAKERRVDEWSLTPGRDNHWWDCLVGSAVAASTCGIALKELPTGGATPRREFSLPGQGRRKR